MPGSLTDARMDRMKRICAAWGWALAAGVAPAQTLTLHFQDRPPYSSRADDGRVTGLVATPAERALSSAGIPFRWALTPSQRQLALIQSGQGPHCGIGWFRTAEREAKGRFSRPLYRDQPLAALVRDGVALPQPLRVDALLADPRRRLLVKEGYSYGPALDEAIAAAASRPERTSVDPPQMARMLLAARADWMIVAPEEAQTLIAPGLRLVEFADVAAGPTRHLYCSADLPDDWLARIDRALAATVR